MATKLSRRSWLKVAGSVLTTPSAIIGGTLLKMSNSGPKPIYIGEPVKVMGIPDGWYIQHLHEAQHPFGDVSNELAYRGFSNPIDIPNKSGNGYRISANSLEEAMARTSYLSGLYSDVLIVNIKNGKPWYQALRVLSENEIRKDSQGLIGSPSGLEELVRQEGEFIAKDPSNKSIKVADWKLVLALIAAESNFDPEARGIKLKPVYYKGNGRYSFERQRDVNGDFDYSGAISYGQVKAIAAKDVGMTSEDLNHRRLNVRATYRYLNSLIQRFGDDATALYAYNRGPTDTKRDLAGRGLKYPESINHANKVIELYREARLEEARRQRPGGIGA